MRCDKEKRVQTGDWRKERRKALCGIAELCPDYLSSIVTQYSIGRDGWPGSCEAWLCGRTPEYVIVASDGLSDPFIDENELSIGFGHEVIMACDEPISDVNFSDSWVFRAIHRLSFLAAEYGTLREIIEDYGSLSVELNHVDLPECFIGANGCACVLLGELGPPLAVDTKYGDIVYYYGLLLTVEEGRFISCHEDSSVARSILIGRINTFINSKNRCSAV